MKLLINFLQSHSGGARSYLRNILPYINHWPDQENLKVYILLYKQQLDADKIDASQFNIKPIIIDTIPKFKPLAEQRVVWKTAKKLSVDILFTPYQVAFPVKGVKLVLMLRNMEPFLHWKFSSTSKNRIRNIVLQLLSSYSLKNADLAIAVSDFAKDYMVKQLGIPPEKIDRIYHGRDHRFSSTPTASDADLLHQFGVDSHRYIFTSGSILPYRKLETILEAFALSEASRHYKLVVAGDSNDTSYKTLIDGIIERCQLSKKVVRMGFIDIEQIMVLYRHAKLFITATEIEACPNIAIEAMSSGCPIIASDKPPLPEMFEDKAIYFKAGDIDSLANKLDTLSSAAEQPRIIDYKLDRFSWKLCADETLRAIKSVI